MVDKDYEAGLRDGRISAIERTQKDHHERMNIHDKRLTAQERITYMLLGALVLIQGLSALKEYIV